METENELLTDELLHNLIQDFRKRDISMSLKWRIIKECMNRNHYSINDAVKFLGIGKTTLHTWRRAYELGEEKHKELLTAGWTESEIQNALKNNSSMNLIKKVNKKKIDLILDEAKTNLSEYIHKKDYSIETEQKIKDLINILNRILMRTELK
jgi:transposase-like protein